MRENHWWAFATAGSVTCLGCDTVWGVVGTVRGVVGTVRLTVPLEGPYVSVGAGRYPTTAAFGARAQGSRRYFRKVGRAEPAARVGTAPFKVQVSKDRIRNGVVSWGSPLFPKPHFVVSTVGTLSGPKILGRNVYMV